MIDLNTLHSPSSAFATVEGITTISGAAYVRPSTEIVPEAVEAEGINSIADRYKALTGYLPLKGASGLANHVSGKIRLIAKLRAAAPWLESAIGAIERQLRVQLWAGRSLIAWRPLRLAGPPGTGKSYLACH